MRLRELLSTRWYGAVVCRAHTPDLDALRRFVADGRPWGSEAAMTAIAGRDCPACLPRYLAGYSDSSLPPFVCRSSKRGVTCPCCGTTWEERGASWGARAGPGLSYTGVDGALHRGHLLLGDEVAVVPFDPWRPEGVFRDHFSSGDAGISAGDDLATDLAEAVAAALSDRADLDAEVERVAEQHGLSVEERARWEQVVRSAADVVREAAAGERRSASVRCARCDDPSAGVNISEERFAELVAQGIASIPAELSARVENVAVVLEDRASDGHLAGLFHGVPLTRQPFGTPLQSRIVLYRETLCRHADTEEELAADVAATVVHEVGHYFGFDDAELRRLGW